MVRIGPTAIVLLYAAGLFAAVSSPWTGIHDWNGAFFSELARNEARYPFSIHHGIPIVAVGADVPPADERSLYATHPPALVWFVQAMFALFGSTEAAARLLPIACSIATIVLLMTLWRRAYSGTHALTAGLFYAVMPMSVYFGRMVDHEAVCLCLMTLAAAAWVRSRSLTAGMADARARAGVNRPARYPLVLAATALSIAIWVDWVGCLFAGLFGLYLLRRLTVCDRHERMPLLVLCAVLIVSLGGMCCYLVYAGLDGHWDNLLAVFTSRATGRGGDAPARTLATPGSPWTHTLSNFSWPLLILAAFGVLTALRSLVRSRSAGLPPAGDPGASSAEVQQSAVTMLRLIALTGVIWLALFARQYRFHQYWVFYLGPAAASCAASALLRIRAFTESRGDLKWAPLILVLVVLYFESGGARAYFALRSDRLESDVRAWTYIADATRPSERIVLYRDPTWTERRGDYVFRNIVPPQFAWYADRRFTIERDPARIGDLATGHALFALPVQDALRLGPELNIVRRCYPERLIADSWVVFDLRNPLPTSMNQAPKPGASRPAYNP